MTSRRRFRFIREIAEGGFGKVYLAEMQSGANFSSVVAIKVLHGKWAQNEEIAQRSRDEARLLGRLRHRNIVRVEDLTSIHGQCAVIMEYLEGVDLKTLINTISSRGERLPLRCCFEIIGAVSEALRAAYNHAPLQGGEALRLIHRDIKPSNIMLTVGGDVKLLDFGTARANFEQREARTQALAFGSQAYMAPERMMGDPDGPACDIFSLGVTCFEIVHGGAFGKIPVRPDRFHTVVDERVAELNMRDLSPELAERTRRLIRSMMSYEPDDRPDAGQVVDVMEILGDEARDTGLRRFARGNVQEIADANPHSPDGPSLADQTIEEDRSPVGEPGGLGPQPTIFAPEERVQDGVAGEPLALQEGATIFPEDLDEEESSDVELLPPRSLPPHLKAVQNLPTQALGIDHEAPTMLKEEEAVRDLLAEDWPIDEPSPEDSIDAVAAEPAPEADAADAQSVVEEDPDKTLEAVPVAPEADGAGPDQSYLMEETAPPPEAFPPPVPVPAPKKKTSKWLLFGVMIGVFFVTVVVGGALVVGWFFFANFSAPGSTTEVAELTENETPSAPLAVKTTTPTSPDKPKSTFKVVGPAGGVLLTVEPESERDITLNKTGAGKLTVSGSGPIEVPSLHQGTWRTKTTGPDGTHRGDFEVVVGKTCSYRLDLGATAPGWVLEGCEQ